MTNLTTSQILDLAYEDGLQVIEENGYKGDCDYVLSYKEFLADTNSNDDDEAFENYKTSLSNCIIEKITTLTVSKTELLKALDVCIQKTSTSGYLIDGLSPVAFLSEDCGSWVNMYSGFSEWLKNEGKEDNEETYQEFLQGIQDFIKNNLLDEVQGVEINYID
jgi:hypothetical protein